MAALVLNRAWNSLNSRMYAIRFRDGSWFRVFASGLPERLKLTASAIICLDDKLVLKCVNEAVAIECNYILRHADEAPIVFIMTAQESPTRQCLVLASRENLIVVSSLGCSTAEINEARTAFFDDAVCGTEYDARIEELIRIQQESEVEKANLIEKRKRLLRTSRFVFPDTLRARLLPWEELRRDFGYIGDSLHKCADCGSHDVDKFVITDNTAGILQGEADHLYVRCLNTECDNSAGQVYAADSGKPEWLLENDEV